VPNTPSDLCLVKVYDPTDGNPSDVSDAVFEILPPDLPSASITVMDPNGGENIYAGSVYEVQWQATNFSDLVNIDLSVDNGQTWSTIATDQAATGTYSWNVPGVTTSTALIRVYDKTDQVPSDTSDNVFTILPPQQPSGDELIVTYPNGGEELIAGRTYKLQWDSDGYTGEVNVSVSVDSGATWTELADNQPDSGSFAWQVSMISTSKGLVKVADAVDGDPMDISDAPFSIIPQPPVEEDYALSFDGMDDFVEIPNDPSLNISENFTIEFWIKTDNPQQAWTRVLEKGSWDQYYIGFYNNHGRMHGALRTKDGENDTKMTIPVGPAYTRMVANEWYHVAATYDGQFAKIYINGILESTKEAEVQPREVTGELILGAVKRLNGYEYHMDAVIDEMRFWNQARSVDDIVDEMYTELTGTESNLAAYYSFNEGSGQMLNDLSANGNHGRLGMTTLADGSDPTWVPSDRPTTPAPERAGEQLAKDASGFDTQGMPEEFGLMQNYPNPFNAGTTISFNIPDSEYGDQTIRLMIFDLQGRVIKTLTQGSYQPGRHQVYWDGSTDDGEMAASGVYFYRLIAGDYSVSKRMVMLK
jgi:hypothetical protein